MAQPKAAIPMTLSDLQGH